MISFSARRKSSSSCSFFWAESVSWKERTVRITEGSDEGEGCVESVPRKDRDGI